MLKALPSDRLEYEKGKAYNKKVLIGKWFDDRAQYVQQKYNHRSLVEDDYVPKEYSALDPSVIWNHKITHQGLGPSILLGHGGPFQNNFTTTYDISYKILPCLALAGRKKEFQPIQDFARSYGNMTDYGLTAYFKDKWKDEIQDPPSPLKSEMKERYIAPELKDYTWKRRAIPYENSCSSVAVNLICVDLKLRGRQISLAPESKIKSPKSNIPLPCPMHIKKLKLN